LDWRPEFRGYDFTGALRPGKLSPERTVPDHIARPDYATHPRGESESELKSRASHSIEVKSAEEIERMRAVSKIGVQVLHDVGTQVQAGMTTDDIDALVHQKCVELGAYPSPLRYKLFPKSCCTSLNEVVCHGIPDSTVLREGDIVNVDISIYYQGYHTDLNETWLIGQVDAQSKLLVDTTYQCLQEAIKIVKPGTMYREVGNVITRLATHHGLSVARAYCGHGIGKLFHCAPNVPHYAKNKAIGVMKPGHIFTIEPMINLGTWKEVLWPDDWTSTTMDGKRSAQFEHTLLVTESGCEVLTQRTQGTYIDRFV
jgi:methionyl aminopeptidase